MAARRLVFLRCAAPRRSLSGGGGGLPFEVKERPESRASRERRNLAKQDFPTVGLKQALLRSRDDSALPIESAPLSQLPGRRRSYDDDVAAQARVSATGDVRLLLDAMERSVAHLAPGSALDERPVWEELDRAWSLREEQGRGRPMTAQTVCGVLRAAKHSTAAMHFFSWSGSQRHQPFFHHSSISYNGLVEMLARRGFINEALKMYRIMRRSSFRDAGCGADASTLGIIVRRLLMLAHDRTEQQEQYLAVATRLVNEGLDYQQQNPKERHLVGDDLLHDMVEHLARRTGMLPLALRYFHRCRYPGSATYQVLVRSMCRQGHCDEAYELIVAMAQPLGVPTDDVTYHSLIAEFCRRGELSKAHVLLLDFIERGRTPTVLTFNSVLELLCKKKGDKDLAAKAQDLRRRMLELGVEPNVMTYSLLLQCLGRGGRSAEALEMLREMKAKGITSMDGPTSKELVMGLVADGLLDEAFELAMALKRKEWTGPAAGADIAPAVVYGFLRQGKVQASLRAMKQLQGNLFRPDLTMYNVFITVLCRKGRFSMAKTLYKELSSMKLLEPDANTYEPFVVGYCDAGLLPDAYKLFKEMLAKKCRPSLAIYRSLVVAFAKKGSMSDSAQLLEHMFNNDCYPDAEVYRAVINGLHRTGNTQACDLLSAAVSQSGGQPDEHMFKAVFKLRNCIRLVRRRTKDVGGEGDDQDEDDELEQDDGVAQVVEAISGDGQRMKFSSSSESDSESGRDTEDDDRGTCNEILRSLGAEQPAAA